ncbi:MAG: hypothetical protein IT191_00630 [Microbacteriaceae bacterium]|nr:hypothetical protein [Cryobacterium sp.]MCC6375505.1 hypothetical protein [Microbacteriaceae bacterium]
MRKFLLSGAVLGAVFGGMNTLKSTIQGPRNWRLALRWVIWGATIAIAVGSVIEKSRATEFEE